MFSSLWVISLLYVLINLYSKAKYIPGKIHKKSIKDILRRSQMPPTFIKDQFTGDNNNKKIHSKNTLRVEYQ